MKASVCRHYGSPAVLHVEEVPKPAPGPDEVHVRVHAASLNFGDTALVQGKPWLVRLMGYGLLKPRYPIVGTDIAGRVEAVGGGASQFRVGDEVFGDISDHGLGALAEYVAVPPSALTAKPPNLTFEQAAAVPQAAVVALQGLRDEGRRHRGEKVLINGASGGVGTFAVQIARALGADVTGVCSGKNADLVRSLGAGRVIDHTQEDFTQGGPSYDLILDIVADRSLRDYLSALRPGGAYVAVAFNPMALFFGSILSRRRGLSVSALNHKPRPEDLAFLSEWLISGEVVPVIDRSYPLDQAAEAMRYLVMGRHHGKVAIVIESNGHERQVPSKARPMARSMS